MTKPNALITYIDDLRFLSLYSPYSDVARGTPNVLKLHAKRVAQASYSTKTNTKGISVFLLDDEDEKLAYRIIGTIPKEMRIEPLRKNDLKKAESSYNIQSRIGISEKGIGDLIRAVIASDIHDYAGSRGSFPRLQGKRSIEYLEKTLQLAQKYL